MSAYGLCHLGDYEATLFSKWSHNRMYGESFAKGDRFTKLAEGVMTSKALYKLGQEYGVDLPIVESVYKVLFDGTDIKEALRNSVYAFCQERILIGQVHNMGNTKTKKQFK